MFAACDQNNLKPYLSECFVLFFRLECRGGDGDFQAVEGEVGGGEF